MVDNSDMNCRYGFKHSWNIVTTNFEAFGFNTKCIICLPLVPFRPINLKLRIVQYKLPKATNYSIFLLNVSLLLLGHVVMIKLIQILVDTVTIY